jgi:hypothetical protein
MLNGQAGMPASAQATHLQKLTMAFAKLVAEDKAGKHCAIHKTENFG